jgi:hypothetical protein
MPVPLEQVPSCKQFSALVSASQHFNYLFESCKDPSTPEELLEHWQNMPNNTNAQENVGKQIQEAWRQKKITLPQILPQLCCYIVNLSKNRAAVMEGYSTKYSQSQAAGRPSSDTTKEGSKRRRKHTSK